jgi:hypothetical protein
VLDAHYRQSAIEHLRDIDLTFKDAPTGSQGKYDSFMFVRGLLRAGQLKLPNAPRLLAQMRAVVAVPMSGGGTRISSPRRAGGGHGDTVSALVLACWNVAHSARAGVKGGSSFVRRPDIDHVSCGYGESLDVIQPGAGLSRIIGRR